MHHKIYILLSYLSSSCSASSAPYTYIDDVFIRHLETYKIAVWKNREVTRDVLKNNLSTFSSTKINKDVLVLNRMGELHLKLKSVWAESRKHIQEEYN